MIRALVGLIVIITLLPSSTAHCLERCKQYVQTIRKANAFYWGVDFPYWYAVAQAQHESLCRPTVVAFDKGEGLFQFMPATADEVREDLGEYLDTKNPQQAAKMNAFYMHKLHKQNSHDLLWLTYQAYNGGWKTLKKEMSSAGKIDWYSMRIVCKRKVIKLRSGNLLDMCEVNYSYSKKIHETGKGYSKGKDSIKFW